MCLSCLGLRECSQRVLLGVGEELCMGKIYSIGNIVCFECFCQMAIIS